MAKSSVQRLPSNLKGKTLQIRGGKSFTVGEGEYYPADEIAQQHRKYLGGLDVGRLVSVSFRGHPTPLVVVTGGVVRLKSITTGRGKTIEGSTAIAQELGVEETRSPLALSAE